MHKEKIFELSSVYHLLTEGKGKSLWESVAVPGIVSNSTSNAARLPHPHKWKSRNFVLSNIKCLYRRHRPCKQAVPFYSAGKGRDSHTAGQVSVSVFVWPQYVCSLHQLQHWLGSSGCYGSLDRLPLQTHRHWSWISEPPSWILLL